MLCCGKSKVPFECNIELLNGSHITYSKAQNIKLQCVYHDSVRRVKVTLVDNIQFGLESQSLSEKQQRSTKCQILFDAVCTHIKLSEKEYFGLFYYDNQALKHWLDPHKSFVEDITFIKVFENLPCILYFGVRFYAVDPCALKEEITRYQFFLQLKKDILDSKLTCSQKRAAEVSALALQSEIGDYHPSEHKRGYVSEFRFLENQTEKFEMEVARLHATYKGLVPASAEMQFLKKCRQFDTYGIELYGVRGETGTQYDIGISPRGIEKFKNKQKITIFYWPRIESVNFKDKNLKIEVMSKQGRTSIHTFILPSPALCQYVLKSIVDHHVFYRLPQNNLTSTWGRKQSGRIEAEILQSEVEREEPEVERGSSKRYPPRPKLPGHDDNKENNDETAEVEKGDADTNWSSMLLGKKGGMFSNTDASPNKAVNYMTPKNERKERNRQLQSLSDTENRHRRHRSRGRSSGDESDSPSKRRIRARARRRSNIASDGSEISHVRRRRGKCHTDTEMTHGFQASGEKRSNNINSRRTKRMSKEDLSARQQLFQHIQKDFVDISNKSPEELKDIPYTEIKTEGNPHHVKSRYHSRRHHSFGKRASGVSANSYTQALEDEMVPPLPVTITATTRDRRNHENEYASPGKDWDTRTAPSFDSTHYNSEARTKPRRKHRRSTNNAEPGASSPMYSQI